MTTRTTHPGDLRLGRDTAGRPYMLRPVDLGQHVFIPGATSTGKTVTIRRLLSWATAADYGVITIDFKAGGLGEAMRRLAALRQMPFYTFDLNAPDSLGYNPCAGPPASVANKIIGSFDYAGTADIYKQIGMAVVPVIVAARQGAGLTVGLDDLHEAFLPNGLNKLAGQVDEPYTSQLRSLEALRGKEVLIQAGYIGLQARLDALRQGVFGLLLRAPTVLDWDVVLARPSVAHIALSALASSEDVELVGRVLIQDMKQLAARRILALRQRQAVPRLFVVIDEFASAREGDQLSAFLLQAREARMTIVVGTQFLPESRVLRTALMGAGLIVAHRVDAEDADLLAAQFGTRPSTDMTHTFDLGDGTPRSGSVRRSRTFNVSPDDLLNLATGEAAVRAVNRPRPERHLIVTVDMEEE